MSRLKGIHWLAPTTMLVSLFIGALFALGHDMFYHSFDGKAVATGSYHIVGKQIIKQQFNTSVGTAFAFLVRTFLGIAISTAYIQIFWRCIKITKQSPTLGELDWAGSGLNNLLVLFNLKIWTKYPLLVLLALIFWCIPIATIIPPATLSVKATLLTPSKMVSVPQLDFTNFNYVAGLQFDGATTDSGDWEWVGPSQPVQHIALATAGLGQILPITPPSPNATWTLDFWGPAIQCNNVPGTKRDEILLNIWNSFNSSLFENLAFLSWVPWTDSDANAYYLDRSIRLTDPDLPFLFNVDGGSSSIVGPTALSVSTDGPLSLFVAVVPEAVTTLIDQGGATEIYFREPSTTYCIYNTVQSLDQPMNECVPANATFRPAQMYDDTLLLRCDLVNTSYTVNFHYTNGEQEIQIFNNFTESKTLNGSTYFHGPLLPDSETQNSSALNNCSPFQTEISPNMVTNYTCVFDAEAVRLSTYQGIMAAFNQLLLGTIRNQGSAAPAVDTMLLRTVLAATEDLASLRDWNNFKIVNPDLSSVLLTSRGWAYPGLVHPDPPSSHGDLKSALEQLFQNFTISLLAEPYLQPNYSSVFAPPEFTNVTSEIYENVYNYDRPKLWISYALSILFSTIAVIAGVVALLLNGASYNNNFSTLVRTSRTAELSTEVKPADGSGYAPLPSYLKHARFAIGAPDMMTYSSGKIHDEVAEGQSLVGRRRKQSKRADSVIEVAGN